MTKFMYFAIIAIMYLISYFITNNITNGDIATWNSRIIIMISSIIFTLVIFGMSLLFEVDESFDPSSGGGLLKISPGKMCRGGPYMWQGSSEKAKMCRQLASTPEGRAEIASYNCGAGFTGMPGCNFKYTPMSNSCYQNSRCNNMTLNVRDNGIF